MNAQKCAPSPRKLLSFWVLLILGALCAAPTPGDVGGCGQEPALLDPPTFFANKKRTDCRRCEDCGIETQACNDACDSKVRFETEFPDGCLPLVHDGEVCLRALKYAGCDDYESYMDDAAPGVPSECNFCPVRGSQ